MTVSCILCCCLLAQAEAGWEVPGQPGAVDGRRATLLRELSTSRGLALEKIRTSLGLEPGKLPIRWVLRLERAGKGAAGDQGEAGWTEVGDREVVVTLPAWRYLAFPMKARRVVIHEAVHAVMASRMGTAAAYRAVPRWFREGVALLVSGEGPGRVNDRISATLLRGGNSADILGGVASRQVYPAEGYLAVLWLEARLGKAGFRELLSRIAAGGAFNDELEKLTGFQSARLQKAVLLDSTRRISRLVSRPSERLFSEAVARARAGDYGRAREKLGVLTGPEGSRALRDSALFLHARTLVEEGLYSAAARRLESLLRDGYEVPWEPEIFEQLGRCRQGMGRRVEAARLWRMVVERFPHDSAVQGRIRGFLDGLKSGG